MEFDYLAAANDKHLLLENSPSPKIILVGGSNLAFGVDSSQIEQQIGYPVVNMGLHGGLGLRYMLSEIRENITADDIVIISPEYGHFYFPSVINGSEALLQMLLLCPRLASYLEYNHFIPMVKNFPKALQKSFRWIIDSLYAKIFSPEIRKKEKKVYVKDKFNQYGDFTNHLDLPPPEKFLHEINIPESIASGPEAVSILNTFFLNAEQKSANVFFLFPPIPDYAFKQYTYRINNFSEWLKSRMNVTILSTPDFFVLPKNYFFDSPYHLNREGRKIRTQKIISLLKNVLKK